jgi:O-antigen/teichoic acid export membrane protein
MSGLRGISGIARWLRAPRRSSTVAAQVATTLAARIVTIVGRTSVFLCAVRTLQPVEYGYYSLIGSTISIASLVATGNIAAYLIRALPGTSSSAQYRTFKKLLFLVLRANFGLAVLGIGVYAALYRRIPLIVCLLAVLLLLELASPLAESFFLGCNRVYAMNVCVLVRTTLFAAITALLWPLMLLNLNSLIMAWIAADFGALVAAYCMMDGQQLRNRSSSDVRMASVAKYSLPLLGASLAWMLVRFGDRYLVAYFLGVPAVAPYDIAYKVVNTIYSLTALVVSTVLVPRVMHAENTGDDRDRDRSIASGTKLAMCAFGACLVAIIASPSWVWVKVTGHPGYHDVRGLAIVLGTSTLVGVAANPAQWVLLAKKRTGALAVIDTCGAGLIGILECVTIPLLGLYGAAMSTFIGLASTCVAKHAYARSKMLSTLRTFTDWSDEKRFVYGLAEAIGIFPRG